MEHTVIEASRILEVSLPLDGRTGSDLGTILVALAPVVPALPPPQALADALYRGDLVPLWDWAARRRHTSCLHPIMMLKHETSCTGGTWCRLELQYRTEDKRYHHTLWGEQNGCRHRFGLAIGETTGEATITRLASFALGALFDGVKIVPGEGITPPEKEEEE